MYLKEIELEHFRNYDHQQVCFHDKVNIITGNNAQGKTNLLESLYIMSLGKSFRTSRDTEMIAFGEKFFRAKSKSSKDGEELVIEIAVSGEGKSVRIDGVRARRTADLLEHVYMVIFSPEDMKIVKEDPEKRRKFMDRELCQLKPVYFGNLSRYKKLLMNRNVLLRKNEGNSELCCVYDEGLADYGARIIKERRQFVEKLSRMSGELHKKITDGRETLSVSYECGLDDSRDTASLKEEFQNQLRRNFRRDVMRGTTGVGPHRDDLKLMIDGVDIRHYGSQGQQRTAALSLKLAELYLIKEETGEDAILLLDDVLSELDIQRQTFLLSRLHDVQIFITAAELSETLLSNLSDRYVFEVKNGTVTRV